MNETSSLRSVKPATTIAQSRVSVNLPDGELLHIYRSLYSDILELIHARTGRVALIASLTLATADIGDLVAQTDRLYAFAERNGLLSVGMWTEGEPDGY